jgi:putative FmdB family regulatory protein
MPTYEYVCQACDSGYEEQRPFAQADAPSRCPECGSAHVRRRLSTVIVLTAAGSNSGGGCACSSGGTCACRAAHSHN